MLFFLILKMVIGMLFRVFWEVLVVFCMVSWWVFLLCVMWESCWLVMVSFWLVWWIVLLR